MSPHGAGRRLYQDAAPSGAPDAAPAVDAARLAMERRDRHAAAVAAVACGRVTTAAESRQMRAAMICWVDSAPPELAAWALAQPRGVPLSPFELITAGGPGLERVRATDAPLHALCVVLSRMACVRAYGVLFYTLQTGLHKVEFRGEG